MIIVVGVSHKTAPVDVRERFAANREVIKEMLERLSKRPELSEVLFLSTCNRVEVVARPEGAGSDPDDSPASAAALLRAAEAVREELALHGGASKDAEFLYEKRGDDAVRHVFRVASSLDSMVLGEPQILGQVKDAYDHAVAAGALSGQLGRCVHRAFTVAKRIRTETAIGAGTVSISSIAVDLARSIFGALDSATVLLVGAGEMAEAAARSLGKDAKSIRVCNRSLERAAELAAGFGASAATLEDLEAELTLADVVVASTGSTRFVITHDMVKKVMKARRGRTLFIVDIAVPRNVDPKVHGIDNVYVFNVDDLEAQVAAAMTGRASEVVKAEAIVEDEMRSYRSWRKGLTAQPLLVSLRARTRAVLEAELERTLSTKLKHLSEADRAALVTMLDSATNKLLHAPTSRLKEKAGDEDAKELARTLEYLFDLPTARGLSGMTQPPEPPSTGTAEPPSADEPNPENPEEEKWALRQ